ncbi:F0F1 ATP synthase subunit delta [Neisseria flavescens]|uniref:ATP synthase subunit delta n=1 Tax=Neisseria flavescens NRL30031/H210 TaxID=546264 RepID=C0ELX2_NEIFL|nr:F0F1 ATP synthase subunit delta [Neisseria flavescens]SPY01022.1 ATP synthase subunit delta [Neisseria meningitidis]EEG33976.1 ATP synthase F1, delta subunit [Neisseria flavescens NRL30031/H210]QCL69421.1 F0F1 ATP synthase subunit delta [Neisseria flavescens]SPY05840.1 ATP synthase subunit delta [Neisseria meningitidis]STZ65974.1 ATP synthase subunit delta [Neisseria flavescens]
MAEFATIARPYAKALFSLAQEKNQIESWLGELKELAAVVQDEKVIAFIEQPETGASEKAETLKGLVGIKNVELANFITVLAEQKRLLVLPEIYAQYQDLTLIHNNTKSAVVYSAYELSSQQLADVTDILTKRFNSKLDVVAKVAPELIGGIKVEVGDQVLDLSVQSKLNALYATMTN